MKLPDFITLIARTQIYNQILKSFERVECCYFSPVKAPSSVENESSSIYTTSSTLSSTPISKSSPFEFIIHSLLTYHFSRRGRRYISLQG